MKPPRRQSRRRERAWTRWAGKSFAWRVSGVRRLRQLRTETGDGGGRRDPHVLVAAEARERELGVSERGAIDVSLPGGFRKDLGVSAESVQEKVVLRGLPRIPVGVVAQLDEAVGAFTDGREVLDRQGTQNRLCFTKLFLHENFGAVGRFISSAARGGGGGHGCEDGEC